MYQQPILTTGERPDLQTIADDLLATWQNFQFDGQGLFTNIEFIGGTTLVFTLVYNGQPYSFNVDLSKFEYPYTEANAEIRKILEDLGFIRPITKHANPDSIGYGVSAGL